MRIVHLSYARVNNVKDPAAWIRKIGFFTGILASMATTNQVFSSHGIDYSGTLESHGVTYRFFASRWWDRIFHYRLHAWVRHIRPDAVIVHGLHFPWCVLCLRFLVGPDVKIFVQHHAEKPSRLVRRVFQSWADKFISGYFFSSLEMSAGWLTSRQISNQSKVHEVMEVSSVFESKNTEVPERRSSSKGESTYLWVGRLDKNKDPITLLTAFVKFLEQHARAKLYMVFQTNDLLPEVQSLADGHSGNIILVGLLQHYEMKAIYDQADFIISTSHYEGSGVAVCEAMSRGCIPILSGIASFRMMTSDGEVGFLFQTGNSLSLHESLEKSLLVDKNLERQRVLQHFHNKLSFRAIADKMIQVINAG